MNIEKESGVWTVDTEDGGWQEFDSEAEAIAYTMRDKTLSVADRSYLLVNAHADWITTERAEIDFDDFDDIVDTLVYGYLESAASPLRSVTLFDEELDGETCIYTADFVYAISVAIEKVIG